MKDESDSFYDNVDDIYNMYPICEIKGPLDLVFYVETSFNAKNYHLSFYSNTITALIEKFAFKLIGNTETKIRVKTYKQTYNHKRKLSEIWSIDEFNQQMRIVLNQ